MEINIGKTVKFLRFSENVYILAHQSPDGDTIGASFALYHMLKNMGKRVRVLCSDVISPKYDFISKNYNDEEFECETVIAVDVADVALLGNLTRNYGDKIDLSIDHHISNTGYAKFTCVDPHAAACCELLYRIIVAAGEEITPRMAECLYTGIVTDTGCFRFSNTTSDTHAVASRILNVKFPYAEINRKMFEIKTIERIKLENTLLSDMRSYFDGKCNMVIIRSGLLDMLGLTSADLEGVTSLTTQVLGVEVGVTVKEHIPADDGKKRWKVSMRSTGNINVSELCKTLGGGGGHVAAAGCMLIGSEEGIVWKILDGLRGVLG